MDEHLLINCTRILATVVSIVLNLKFMINSTFMISWLPINAESITSIIAVLLRSMTMENPYVGGGGCDSGVTSDEYSNPL
jgi:hypothetical protein